MLDVDQLYTRARSNAADAHRAIRLADEREVHGRREEATDLRLWALDRALEASNARDRARALRHAAASLEMTAQQRTDLLHVAEWDSAAHGFVGAVDAWLSDGGRFLLAAELVDRAFFSGRLLLTPLGRLVRGKAAARA